MASEKTVILITGANSGIGLETVIALSQASANFHILLGSRSLNRGNKALQDIQSDPHLIGTLRGTISVLQIDVSDKSSIQSAKGQVEGAYGKLDVLINNAGVIVIRPCDTLSNLRETFETNVFGPMIVTEIFESLLRKSTLPSPYIIYVSSEQGSVTLRLDPDYKYKDVRGDTYRMSKASMNMLAACHKFNYADLGWKVLAFNPGFCVTNLTGEKGREMRINAGARSARDPADALVEIILGKRDEDVASNGIVDLDGGVQPW